MLGRALSRTLAPRAKVPARRLNIYRPGDVIRVNRVLKKVDRKLEGAEAEAARQIGWAVSLGVVFIGLPWAWNAAMEASEVSAASDAGRAKDDLQQTVYDRRLENRAKAAADR